MYFLEKKGVYTKKQIVCGNMPIKGRNEELFKSRRSSGSPGNAPGFSRETFSGSNESVDDHQI